MAAAVISFSICDGGIRQTCKSVPLPVAYRAMLKGIPDFLLNRGVLRKTFGNKWMLLSGSTSVVKESSIHYTIQTLRSQNMVQ